MKNLNSIIQLRGYDEDSKLFFGNYHFIRGIYIGKGEIVRKIVETCKKNDLFKHGIVKTTIHKFNIDPHKYDLMLKHEKLSFISYPHEWSTEMLKDAALFHIELFSILHKYNLTLKDWHPWNILFEFSKPTLVDFTSIIPENDLNKQKYLHQTFSKMTTTLWSESSIFVYQMYLLMFKPYFLYPLYLYSNKNYENTRKRIYETTLNVRSKTITVDELFHKLSVRRFIYIMLDLFKKIALINKDTYKIHFFSLLKREISNMNVSASTSAYTNYYNEKKENYSFKNSNRWTEKQKTIKRVLLKHNPKTVLDIGANTGWFSVLAAKLGCDVVAIDKDEECVNNLYRKTKKEHYRILPLVIDILHLPEKNNPKIKSEQQQQQDNNLSVLWNADKRLCCDTVMVLALIHHLCLGMGKSFDEIMTILKPFIKKQLILEYVDIEDELIIREPGFFPYYFKNKRAFSWYTQNNLVHCLHKYFTKIQIEKSYPDSRKILICS